MNHSTPHSHADTERYNRDELILDVLAWRTTSTEKQAAAFLKLIDAAAATALTDQNTVLIKALRELRAERDGTGQPAEVVVPVCAWCSLPAGHTGDHAPLGQVEPTAPGVL